MKSGNRFSSHTAGIIHLALPIWIGQLAAIANPVLDTAMVSRYSVTDLGALAIGASIYISVYVTFNGVMQSLAPTFGQLYGAGKFTDMGHEARQGVWLAMLLSLAGALLLCFPQPFLSIAGTSVEVTEKATLYLRILAFSLPASLNLLVYITCFLNYFSEIWWNCADSVVQRIDKMLESDRSQCVHTIAILDIDVCAEIQQSSSEIMITRKTDTQ